MTGAIRCPHCKVPKAAVWLTAPPQSGCARAEKIAENGMCRSIYIDLLERALRRAVAPQCFNANGFVLPGRLIEALDAARSAIRTAAAINGPVIADTGPGTSGFRTPQPEEAPVSDASAPAWQPIATAPRDETLFLATGLDGGSGPGRHVAIVFCDGAGFFDDFDEYTYLTHWMPLPAPPVDSSAAQATAVDDSTGADPVGKEG